jgi:hypothetical protein|tara:strand:- start:1586 stop:1759 length:174 start_codon:yes stop_codon:yes gene_type:complete
MPTKARTIHCKINNTDLADQLIFAVEERSVLLVPDVVRHPIQFITLLKTFKIVIIDN